MYIYIYVLYAPVWWKNPIHYFSQPEMVSHMEPENRGCVGWESWNHQWDPEVDHTLNHNGY